MDLHLSLGKCKWEVLETFGWKRKGKSMWVRMWLVRHLRKRVEVRGNSVRERERYGMFLWTKELSYWQGSASVKHRLRVHFIFWELFIIHLLFHFSYLNNVIHVQINIVFVTQCETIPRLKYVFDFIIRWILFCSLINFFFVLSL